MLKRILKDHKSCNNRVTTSKEFAIILTTYFVYHIWFLIKLSSVLTPKSIIFDPLPLQKGLIFQTLLYTTNCSDNISYPTFVQPCNDYMWSAVHRNHLFYFEYYNSYQIVKYKNNDDANKLQKKILIVVHLSCRLQIMCAFNMIDLSYQYHQKMVNRSR